MTVSLNHSLPYCTEAFLVSLAKRKLSTFLFNEGPFSFWTQSPVSATLGTASFQGFLSLFKKVVQCVDCNSIRWIFSPFELQFYVWGQGEVCTGQPSGNTMDDESIHRLTDATCFFYCNSRFVGRRFALVKGCFFVCQYLSSIWSYLIIYLTRLYVAFVIHVI